MAPKEISLANTREPLLKPVPIDELRPTQITVGMREVQARAESTGSHRPPGTNARLFCKSILFL